MRKFLVALCAAALLVINPTPAQAEVAPLMAYHWNACTPVLWSYDPSGRVSYNHTRVLKSIRTAAMQAQAMSGVIFREAQEGETPNLKIIIRPTILAGVFADTIPYISTEDKTTVLMAEIELAPALIPKYRSDQKLLFLHEMGHVLGLGHSPNTHDLMIGLPMGSSGRRATKKPVAIFSNPTPDDYTAFASVPDCR